MYIPSWISSKVLFFRNEEKLVALLVHSSFRRVATVNFLFNPVATNDSSTLMQAVLKWAVNTESLFNQHSMTKLLQW